MPLYYNNADAAIIVYDITHRESFEKVLKENIKRNIFFLIKINFV